MDMCENSSVSIATGYGLDGPGIESPWGRDFPHLSRPALGPTLPPVQWVPGLSGVKERPERDAEPSPLLVPWSRKSRAVSLLPLWIIRPVQSLSACATVHFTLLLLWGTGRPGYGNSQGLSPQCMEFSLQFLHVLLSWCCDISYKLNNVWFIRTEKVKGNRHIFQFHNVIIIIIIIIIMWQYPQTEMLCKRKRKRI